VKTRDQPRHGWTTVLRRQPARIVEGQPQGGYWLPTSAEHPWFVILRMYRPHPAVIEAKWECLGITPLT
jgi:hypothetical protein